MGGADRRGLVTNPTKLPSNTTFSLPKDVLRIPRRYQQPPVIRRDGAIPQLYIRVHLSHEQPRDAGDCQLHPATGNKGQCPLDYRIQAFRSVLKLKQTEIDRVCRQ
jgi:hypothetical protein